MTSPTDDEINEVLRKRGVADHVQGIGRQGLIKRWKGFVEEVEAGYKFGIYDYCNDLDSREIIETCGLGQDSEVMALDERFKSLLGDTDYRIWRSHFKDAFWIYGYPKNSGDELTNDIISDRK